MLMIIDINNLIYRCFYGIRGLSYNGIPTNAVYGVYQALKRLIREFNPSHMVITYDSKPTHRLKMSLSYKGTRKSPPSELNLQKIIIEDMIARLGIKTLKMEGYEADDIIGSLCTQFYDEFNKIIVISSDKDLLQLVNDKVNVYNDMAKKMYNEKSVLEKYKVQPKQIIDYLAILGDKADNINGVNGVGKVSIVKLLNQYKNLDNILKNIDGKMKEKFDKSNVMRDKELVKLVNNLNLNISKDDLILKFNNIDGFLSKYNIKG